jgi:hypothetical protein
MAVSCVPESDQASRLPAGLSIRWDPRNRRLVMIFSWCERMPHIMTTTKPAGIELPRWRGFQPLETRLKQARDALYSRGGISERLVAPAEIEKMFSRLPTYDPTRGYHQLKPALASLDTEIARQHGERASIEVGLGMLLHLAEAHEAQWSMAGLDPELKPDFVDAFHRILDAIERGGSGAMRLNSDNFTKELAIGMSRLIPAGGQLIDPGSGVPRSLMLRRPIASIPGRVSYMLRACGGFRPFAEFHTHQRMRHLFTSDGWEYCFRRLPAVFRSRPQLKGVLGGSWFFDPKLASISPNLDFVREVSLRWGGVLIRDGVDPAATGGALSMSEHRRQLHAQGRYQPVSYFMVASKARILQQARSLGLG